MDAINVWLTTFAVTLEGDHRSAGALHRPLWRNFIYEGGVKNPWGAPEVFNLGGRLFGGFWEILPGVDLRRLRIDGDPVGIVNLGQESAIVVSTLLACKAHGVLALPMHQAILTRETDVQRAGAMVREVFHQRAGAPSNEPCARLDLAHV